MFLDTEDKLFWNLCLKFFIVLLIFLKESVLIHKLHNYCLLWTHVNEVKAYTPFLDKKIIEGKSCSLKQE